ncbi:MAG: tRNA pseudouridine(38-40) synthase TruA [Acidimicrobiia bacterium]
MTTVRLDLAYDGTDFHGWARQPDLRTVQGELEAALTTVLGRSVDTVVAGRTDAGVHARHQVVSVEFPEAPDLDRLQRSLRRLVPADVAIWRVAPAPDGFNARFDAVSRAYRYRLDVGPVADPARRRRAWHVPHALDLAAMSEAATAFRGEHDFASFCRRAEGRTTVREVLAADWTADDDRRVRFDVIGSAFCHQQVRSMVAWLVEVGRGRVAAADTAAVLAARDRAAARGAAPAHGLTLWEVRYRPELAEPPDLP